MKIVHVVYSLEMGGAEILVVQLCRVQRANGHDVSVCVYTSQGPLLDVLRADGFHVHVIGEGPVARTAMRFFRVFRDIQPDVVHCHNPAPTIQAAVAARLARVGTIVSTRHSLVAPPFETRAEITYNLISLCCDWVVAICDATRENLLNTPLVQRTRIARVYNGVDRLEPSPLEEHPAKRGFTLLFVGRLAEIKDLPTMIKAVALAIPRIPDLQLWIVGHGIMREPLESLAHELGIENNVTFWGERLDVARFFSTADVFAMSSVSEGLPMSLLQAMSVGLPAVVTNVGGMAEVVRNAHCGLYTRVGDSAAMAEAIVELASNPDRRDVFANNAKTAYAEYFTLERMESAYMTLYRKPRNT